MIRPADFDFDPSASVADPSGAVRRSEVRWHVLSLMLAVLLVLAGAGWYRTADHATRDGATLNARISQLTQERDALNSSFAQLQQTARAAVSNVRVSVMRFDIMPLVDGVDGEPVEPPEFLATGLKTLGFRIEGTHPLCGQVAFTQSLRIAAYLPNGELFRHASSPDGATDEVEASCGPGDGQWRVSSGFGYVEPGYFQIGTWQVFLYDRGTIAHSKPFIVR